MDAELLLRHQRYLRRLVRGLTCDEQAAEDLEQATWLAALERPPRSTDGLRVWLTRVARNLSFNRRRSEAHEAQRLGHAGAERAWPPADEVALELERAERVLAAVRALPEPLRAAVHARYYEECSLEEIARRSGVAPATIKDRLEDARARLRQKLGREWGEERGRLGALAAFVRRSTAWLAGGLLLKKWIALALMLLLLVLGARSFRGPSTPPLAVSKAGEVELAASPAALAGEPAAPAEATARIPAEAAPASAAPATGSLLVTVNWPDGSPAAGVSARVWPDEDGEFVRGYRKLTTLADGHDALDALAPGTWRVQLDRETSFERVELRAGEETLVALAVSGGSRLEGVVVDEHGRPVAGAGVWIATKEPSYPSGEPLDDWLAATTGADGRFAIPAVGKAWIVGARAEGYAPSGCKALRWRRAFEELRLVLPGPGGAIEGRVLARDGSPIEGAVVSGDIGLRYWESDREDGTKYRLILNCLELRATSARDGSFRFGGVQPGAVELTVSTRESPRWSQEIQVSAGATTRVEATLEVGQTLSGRVLTPDGAPLAGLLVFAYASASDEPVAVDAPWLQQDWSMLLHVMGDSFVTTHSRTDGSYRLAGLAAGYTFVAAEHGDAGRTLVALRLEAGVEAHQDLVLARGLELRARLIDENGAPLAGLRVYAQRGASEDTGARGPFTTDAEGLVSIPDCQDAPYTLEIHHARYDRKFRSDGATGLRPGPEEHLVFVEYEDPPMASVSGIVLDDAGRPVSGARVDLQLPGGGSRRIATTDVNGAFRSADFEPGRYGLEVRAPDFPRAEFGAREFPAGETLDVGTVQLKTPGFLDVTLRREDGGPIDDERWHVDLDHPDGSYAWVSFEIELGVAYSGPVEPGDYVLRVAGVGNRPVHVEAGVTHELEVVQPSSR